jgi:Protein of unknown function (DUF3152)
MKHLTFKTVVDSDVHETYGSETDSFHFLVYVYLNSPDGWTQHGYTFEHSESPDVLIRLSSFKTIHESCGFSKKLSCAELNGKKMWLNADRWFKGARASKHDLENYRQYMVSHEMGHILGKEHTKCPCKGCHAPIMLQQTLGIGQCISNTNVKK